MLSKCANPDCTNRFLHLNEGKLFRWDGREILQHPHFRTDHSRPSRKIEFFWLCNDCSRWVTVVFGEGKGIIVRPLAGVQRAAS